MSAEVDREADVYYCIVCGPILRLTGKRKDVVAHQDIPHPEEVFWTDEEEKPQ